MNIKQSFQLAIKSIFANKLRSSLTMLGIIIGVAAVIILVSIMQGFSNSMVNSFSNMGANSIEAYFFSEDKELNLDNIEQLVIENSDILDGVTPSMSLYQTTVSYKDNIIETDIKGVNETYDVVNNAALMYGNFLSYLDVKDYQNKCVLGAYTYYSLFGGENPIGKTVKINGTDMVVQGVLDEISGGSKASEDDRILVPHTSIINISSAANIDSLVFNAVNKDVIEQATFLIEDYFYDLYENYDDFSVFSMDSTVNEMNGILSILSLILIGVASISLIVGGIGIMNIMFVSVTERIKEIGIRTAIGATPADIMGQFIIEAITTTVIGGFIGIIIGALLSYLAAMLINIPFVLPISAVIISFTVSAGIGILFGYLPAKKAALMNPIDALRRE